MDALLVQICAPKWRFMTYDAGITYLYVRVLSVTLTKYPRVCAV